jgi:microcystin-dependent protein
MSSSLGSRYYTPRAFEVDGNGVPIVGAQLFFYVTGTSTPLDTFANATLTTANPNPVVADSTGHYPDIWLTPTTAYKVAEYGPNPDPNTPSTPDNPQGTQIWTADPVGPAASGVGQNVQGIIGEIRMFGGPSASIPPKWYACYGQAVSRTDFAAAFSVIGTAWGVGDGTTTFNLPDFRGRLGAGLDNMGGTGAGRMTAGVSGVPGTTLGGVGGSQNAFQDVLTGVSVVTDPGHDHVENLYVEGNVAAGGTITVAGPPINTGADISTVVNTTGITVTTTVTTASTGTTQNVQPTAMVNMIIYLGV